MLLMRTGLPRVLARRGWRAKSMASATAQRWPDAIEDLALNTTSPPEWDEPAPAGASMGWTAAGLQASAVLDSLRAPTPSVSPSFLYDQAGCELYEKIVALEHYYYLPAAEKALLERHMGAIAQPHGALGKKMPQQAVIELGAGHGHRTLGLVHAIAAAATHTVYVPTDISTDSLDANKRSFAARKDTPAGLECVPIVGTHEEVIVESASRFLGPRNFLFMGSSLGNYDDKEAVELLRLIGRHMLTADRILVGVDLKHSPRKPAARIKAAYDDPPGVTAAFTLNALSHVNAVAGLDFDLRQWRHVCEYDEAMATVFAYAEATSDVEVTDLGTGRRVRRFHRGERIKMEQSRKFSQPLVAGLARTAGLVLTRHWESDDYLVVELRRDFFKAALESSRWLFGEVIADDSLLDQPIGLRQPYLFYLGHCAAFTDIKLLQLAGDHAAFYRAHFERGIDPDIDDPSQCHSHSALPDRWPSPAALRAYEDEVCAAASARLVARAGSSGGGYSRDELMCIEHSAMHFETLLYMRAEQLRVDATAAPATSTAPGTDRRRAAAQYAAAQAAAGQAAQQRRVSIPGGTVALGAGEDATFAWDNESPPSVVEVPAFELDSLAVTNARFLAFVEAGGYKDERWWCSSDAMAWAARQRHPLRWLATGGGGGKAAWRLHLPLGGTASWEQAQHWPAHVTHAEAEAFCAWRGGGARLMSEAEYDRLFEAAATKARAGGASAVEASAAGCHLRSASRGNNGMECGGVPTPVGARDDAPAADIPVFDLVGNGWEWTGSIFAPYDNFTPMPSYPEYSADFFDGKHPVCRGASMLTPRHAIRHSLRNFYQRRYQHVVAKFRLAYNAGE